MKALIEVFEKLQSKYQSKRDRFASTVARFKEKKIEDMYHKGHQLMVQADGLIGELKHDLMTEQGTVDKAAVKTKIKKLKKAYKELHEMSKSTLRQWVEAIVVALVLALVLRNFIFGLYHVPTGSAEPNILVGDRIWGNKMAYFFGPVKRGDLVIFDNPTFDYDRSNSLKYAWQRYIGLPIPLLGLGIGPDNWVKRVIAVPGDTIEGRLDNGKTVVYVNGKQLDEPYVNPLPLISVRKVRGFIPWENIGPLSVPMFLRYEEHVSKYTYDPSKSLSDQPYYNINEEDIVRDLQGKPELDYAYTPAYEHRTLMCMDVFGPYEVPQGKYWVMGDSRKNSADSRWWLFLDQELIHGRASFVIYSLDSEEAFWFFDLIKHPIDFWTKHVRWNRFFKGLDGYRK